MDALTWQRDNTPLPNTGPLVLEDGETATYYNDLVMIGRHPRTQYTCIITDEHDSVLNAMDYKGMWQYCIEPHNFADGICMRCTTVCPSARLSV